MRKVSYIIQYKGLVGWHTPASRAPYSEDDLHAVLGACKEMAREDPTVKFRVVRVDEYHTVVWQEGVTNE